MIVIFLWEDLERHVQTASMIDEHTEAKLLKFAPVCHLCKVRIKHWEGEEVHYLDDWETCDDCFQEEQYAN